MGHIFQAEWWEKHPSGCSFDLLWLRKLAKEMENDLERKNDINWNFIYENNGDRGKGRWKVTSYMWGGNWRKIMENKENIGLINKKASKDQWVGLVSVSLVSSILLELSSILSLSYSCTLRFSLEHSWRSVAYLEFWSNKEKEEKKSVRGHRISIYNGFCL